jgi:hypothetical protein
MTPPTGGGGAAVSMSDVQTQTPWQDTITLRPGVPKTEVMRSLARMTPEQLAVIQAVHETSRTPCRETCR